MLRVGDEPGDCRLQARVCDISLVEPGTLCDGPSEKDSWPVGGFSSDLQRTDAGRTKMPNAFCLMTNHLGGYSWC